MKRLVKSRFWPVIICISMLPITAWSTTEPEFSFLPLAGLPYSFFNSDFCNNLFYRQLIDIDNDSDLDYVRYGSPACLLINAGNRVAPAFEKVFSSVSLPWQSHFADIDRDGKVDLVRNYLTEINSPLIILDVFNDFESVQIENHRQLSFADLVGADEAARIKSLTDPYAFFKNYDIDGDGDLDIEILYDRTTFVTPGPVISFSFHKYLKLENIGIIDNHPFYIEEGFGDDLQYQDYWSQPLFYRFGGLYGDLGDFQKSVLGNITQQTKASLWNIFFTAGESKDYFSILEDYSNRQIIYRNYSYLGDITGDGVPELTVLFLPEYASEKNSAQLTRLLELLNYEKGRFAFDYMQNKLSLLTVLGDKLLTETLQDHQLVLGDLNGDGKKDFLELPDKNYNIANIDNIDELAFSLINEGTLTIKDLDHASKLAELAQTKLNLKLLDFTPGLINFFFPSGVGEGSRRYFYNLIDIDSDGDDDVFVYYPIPGKHDVYVLFNQGFDTSGRLVLSEPVKNPFGLGDFFNFETNRLDNFVLDRIDGDQDGDLDLFVSRSYSGPQEVSYFENTGTNVNPAFGPESPIPFNLNKNSVARFADLEGDGDLDAVSVNFNGDVQLNNQINTRDDQVAHISVRAFSEAGEGRIIGGFELMGKTPQRVLIKGVGPSLSASGIEKPLPDPVLTLFRGQQIIDSNDDWQSGSNSVEGTAFAPPNSSEAVLDVELSPGVYTVHLTDKLQRPGIGIISIDTPIYSYIGSPRPKLRSFRVQVGNGEDVAIVGFVVQDGPKQVVVHGIGPSLIQNGVENPLDDPELLLFSGSKLIARNQGWKSLANADVLTRDQLAPRDEREAVIMQKLEPGTYTVHLRSQQGGQGVGIIGLSTLKE